MDRDDVVAAEELAFICLEVEPAGRTRRLATLDDPELRQLVAATTEDGDEDDPAWPAAVPPAPGQVLLLDPGPAVADVVTVLREHAGRDLAEAKDLVDGPLPAVVVEGELPAEAEALARDLDAAGATVVVG